MKRAGLLLLAALAVAAAVPEPDGYRMDDYRAPVPETLRGAEVFHVEAMRALIDRHAAVLIDVLPAPRRPSEMRPGIPWMPQPHRTLPGSLWWPEVGRGGLPPAMEARFRQRLHEVAGDPPRLVVFFCLSDCWMSWNAAKRAASFGLRVGWFPDGSDAWAAHGLPLQAVQPERLDED
ncbi:MAG TPA: PQQ-dependent catabolism-associated CXXCW motif protein [Acetobacteraceae bacterium]|nr:PQQ-dependent catabolism-associated CXXCW motif protein [Acetobacteraceae bacterium]